MEALLDRPETSFKKTEELIKTIELAPEDVVVGMSVIVEAGQQTHHGRIAHHLGDTYFKLVCELEPPTFRPQLINTSRDYVSQIISENPSPAIAS